MTHPQDTPASPAQVTDGGEADYRAWLAGHEDPATGFVKAPAAPTNPAQVTDAMVEALAEFLCSEFDEDFNPCHGYSWPEHKDDDGYRGGNAYVKLQPSDVQARAREGATRILTFLSQRSAITAAAIGAGGQAVAEDAREALRELANVKMDISLEDWCRISNTILSALSPLHPDERVVEALRAAREFIADEYRDPAYELAGEWLPPDARRIHQLLCEAEAALAGKE